jgi:DNA-binding CsgD family transcriptional regulator
MDRGWLEAQLTAGRSIESIAREMGKHPSTVAYHVKKHGLTSKHAAKHAARGGIPRDTLEPLVLKGLSLRAIAERLDVSYATVQHWVRRYELTTVRAARLKATAGARLAGDATIELECPEHGPTTFIRKSDGGFRCRRCRTDAVLKRRRYVKAVLVEEAGGRCALCGYDRSSAALQFHHLEPTAKEFTIAHRGVTRSLAAARAEARKCVLLCANCHAEVEVGLATLGQDSADNAMDGSARPG